MNPIAQGLNTAIENCNPHLLEMLSEMGRALFFPKGILSQGAEAKQKAHRINATIGIATEKGRTMRFDSVASAFPGIEPEAALTYAPSFGIPELRSHWQDALRQKNPSLQGRSISLPVVTCGITHSVSITADLWIDPQDTVIVPDMMWGNYNLILGVRRGARLIQFPLFNAEGGFNLDGFAETVARQASAGSKVIVLLNFPNNPTGYTVSEPEARKIADILIETAQSGTHVLALFDDAYFGLFFDSQTVQESIFARICNSHPRLLAVKMDGATKENFAWGLRVGFITYGFGGSGDPAEAFDALERKTAGCIRGNISNASHIGQRVVLDSMQSAAYTAEKTEKAEILRRRALKVKSVLSDPRYKDAWTPYPFNSGYFMCLQLKTVDAEKLRVHLLDRYGVGLISIGERNLRVAFSCIEEDQIQELFDTVLKGVADLQPSA